jgi:hypothetical protein
MFYRGFTCFAENAQSAVWSQPVDGAGLPPCLRRKNFRRFSGLKDRITDCGRRDIGV